MEFKGPHADAGRDLATKHAEELKDAVDEHGGGDSNTAVQFMMAYLNQMQALQGLKG
jgi:hypothetical protein